MVANYYKHGGLKQHRFIILHSVVLNSSMGITGLKIKELTRLLLLGVPRVESKSLLFAASHGTWSSSDVKTSNDRLSPSHILLRQSSFLPAFSIFKDLCNYTGLSR